MRRFKSFPNPGKLKSTLASNHTPILSSDNVSRNFEITSQQDEYPAIHPTDDGFVLVPPSSTAPADFLSDSSSFQPETCSSINPGSGCTQFASSICIPSLDATSGGIIVIYEKFSNIPHRHTVLEAFVTSVHEGLGANAFRSSIVTRMALFPPTAKLAFRILPGLPDPRAFNADDDVSTCLTDCLATKASQDAPLTTVLMITNMAPAVKVPVILNYHNSIAMQEQTQHPATGLNDLESLIYSQIMKELEAVSALRTQHRCRDVYCPGKYCRKDKESGKHFPLSDSHQATWARRMVATPQAVNVQCPPVHHLFDTNPNKIYLDNPEHRSDSQLPITPPALCPSMPQQGGAGEDASTSSLSSSLNSNLELAMTMSTDSDLPSPHNILRPRTRDLMDDLQVLYPDLNFPSYASSFHDLGLIYVDQVAEHRVEWISTNILVSYDVATIVLTAAWFTTHPMKL